MSRHRSHRQRRRRGLHGRCRGRAAVHRPRDGVDATAHGRVAPPGDLVDTAHTVVAAGVTRVVTAEDGEVEVELARRPLLPPP